MCVDSDALYYSPPRSLEQIRMWFPPHGFEGQRGGPSGIYLSATVLMGSDTHYKVVFDGETAPEVVRISCARIGVVMHARLPSVHC